MKPANSSKQAEFRARLEALIDEKRASVRAAGGHPRRRTPKPWPDYHLAPTAGELEPDGGTADNPTAWYLQELRRKLDATIERRRTDYRRAHPTRYA